MARLKGALERAGFRTWCATYPSRLMGIGQLARETAARVRAEAPAPAYFAVTHSLGGILVRHMSSDLPWSRVVMLAPPNQGSSIARVFSGHPLFRWFFGPAGQEVTAYQMWPAPPQPFAVIAGTKDLSIANPTSWVTKSAALFPAGAQSDGTITVNETKHPLMSAYAEVEATHTFIMNHPRAQSLAIKFLREGVF
jgi:hypothetical protein